MKGKDYQWFIAPGRGTETNEKLAAYLAQEGLVYEAEDRIMFYNKPIRGWNVPYRIVTDLRNASKVFSFEFRVFVKAGEGQWRQFFLHEKRRISLRSRKAMERLQELINRNKK